MSVKNNKESFISKLNKRGSPMEHWGTPACPFFAGPKTLFICTDCLWID